jgi:16S rRNA processing protein RimM
MERDLIEGRVHGKGIVALLEGCNDRDQAYALIGTDVGIRRDQLPATEDGEFYWADLVGMRVETTAGTMLGHVDHLFETGANDVMVVRGDRERLIPYHWGQVIREVDLEGRLIVVDWESDF